MFDKVEEKELHILASMFGMEVDKLGTTILSDVMFLANDCHMSQQAEILENVLGIARMRREFRSLKRQIASEIVKRNNLHN